MDNKRLPAFYETAIYRSTDRTLFVSVLSPAQAIENHPNHKTSSAEQRDAGIQHQQRNVINSDFKRGCHCQPNGEEVSFDVAVVEIQGLGEDCVWSATKFTMLMPSAGARASRILHAWEKHEQKLSKQLRLPPVVPNSLSAPEARHAHGYSRLRASKSSRGSLPNRKPWVIWISWLLAKPVRRRPRKAVGIAQYPPLMDMISRRDNKVSRLRSACR